MTSLLSHSQTCHSLAVRVTVTRHKLSQCHSHRAARSARSAATTPGGGARVNALGAAPTTPRASHFTFEAAAPSTSRSLPAPTCACAFHRCCRCRCCLPSLLPLPSPFMCQPMRRLLPFAPKVFAVAVAVTVYFVVPFNIAAAIAVAVPFTIALILFFCQKKAPIAPIRQRGGAQKKERR